MPPKPSATGSNLSSYQHHVGSSPFGMGAGGAGSYEDMLSAGVSSGSEFGSKMYGSSLSKSASLPTTGGDVGSALGAGGAASSAFTKHTYEGSKSMGGSAAGGYNYGIPGNQGYYVGVSETHLILFMSERIGIIKSMYASCTGSILISCTQFLIIYLPYSCFWTLKVII